MVRSRLGLYVVAAVVFLLLAARGPVAWATPDQEKHPQNPTIPTLTPTPRPQPTNTPIPPAPVGATAAPTQPSGAAPTPGLTTPTPAGRAVATAAAGALALELRSDREYGWGGATIPFTATLVNVGSVALSNVQLEVTLPPGQMAPVPGVLPAGGSWTGQKLVLARPSLAPGERIVVPFSATTAVSSAMPGVLEVQAAASAAGVPRVTAIVYIAMPPQQLPRTGGALLP